MAGVKLNNGATLPVPGFGTWRCDVALLHAAVVHAIRVGYRHIDCAGLYRNEHIVGAAIKDAIDAGLVTREELWITSKLAPTQMEPALVLPALQKSIADLGVGYLDHYITHWPYAVDPANTASPAPDAARLGYDLQAIYLPVWREMEAAVDAGLVRSLGCSNSTAKKLAALIAVARIPPVAVQVEMHPCLAQPKLVAWAAANGIAITGYCPLGSPGRPDAYRAEGDPDVLGSDVILAFAKETGHSPAQVALKWAAQRGTVPLPRSTNPGRISENFEGACGAWSLSAEAMTALEALDRSTGSVGRIMKGDNFAPAGAAWRDMWDAEWEPTATA